MGKQNKYKNQHLHKGNGFTPWPHSLEQAHKQSKHKQKHLQNGKSAYGHMEHRGLGKYKNKTKQLNITVDVKKKLSSNAAKTHLVGIRL